jgi:two-component system, NarL family, sensor histidine kinase UhpB
MELELRRSEASLADAQRIAKLGNWDLDIASGRLHWSEQIFEIFGLDRRTFGASYEAFIECVHPDDRARLEAAQRAALAGAARLDIEHRIVRPDGTVRTVHELGDLTRDAAGRPVRLVGTVLDITERRRFVEALESANLRLHRLSRRILEVQELEQRALARELHDEIGQSLTAIKINVQSLMRLGLSGRPAERLAEMTAIAEEALNRVKGISLNLRPSQLDDLGLEAALRWNANRQAETADFTVHLDLRLDGARFDGAIETACFRVCQEALTNVVRHAKARNVWISAKVADMQLFVEIRDDGIGFDAQALRRRALGGESFGLLGMEERVELCGGRFEIAAAAGGGTVVRAWFPLAPQPLEVQA